MPCVGNTANCPFSGQIAAGILHPIAVGGDIRITVAVHIADIHALMEILDGHVDDLDPGLRRILSKHG